MCHSRGNAFVAKKTGVLTLDDRGVPGIDRAMRSDLRESIDDRAHSHSQGHEITRTRLAIDHCHACIGDSKLADANRDRLIQRMQRNSLDYLTPLEFIQQHGAQPMIPNRAISQESVARES